MADLLHFPSDKLFGEFRVMTGHVRIGVAENLRQYIYRHPVFHGKTRERVAGAVRCQRLVDIADHSYLFQIGVHPLVARYGEQFPFGKQFFIRSVFLQK